MPKPVVDEDDVDFIKMHITNCKEELREWERKLSEAETPRTMVEISAQQTISTEERHQLILARLKSVEARLARIEQILDRQRKALLTEH